MEEVVKTTGDRETWVRETLGSLFFRHVRRQRRLSLLFHASQRQELFVRLDALRHEFPVPEQSVGRHRGRHLLGGFFRGDVDGFQGNAMFLAQQGKTRLASRIFPA